MKFPTTLVYRLHAVRRMFERQIPEEAINDILLNGKVIQEYKDDKPYPSYLLGGEFAGRPLHVVVSIDHDDQTSIIVTAYEPSPLEWEPGFKVRRKK